MKLRNKKKGEVCLLRISEYGYLYLIMHEDGEGRQHIYNSLAELNEEWEDCKEPLIKDEKIRKAVGAWAEALDLRWFKRCGSVNAHTSRLYGQDANGTGYTMELAPNDLYGGSISKKGYTITELCGENEE